MICSPPKLLWHIPDFPDDQPAHRGSPCILKHGSIQLVQLLASKLCRYSIQLNSFLSQLLVNCTLNFATHSDCLHAYFTTRSSKCTLVNYQLATTDANLGVPIYWTGPLHWTNGLIFELILGVLRNLLMIHIVELSVFLVSAASMTAANYHNAYMELCNCASFKVAGLRKAFIRQMWCICSLIIHEHTTFT